MPPPPPPPHTCTACVDMHCLLFAMRVGSMIATWTEVRRARKTRRLFLFRKMQAMRFPNAKKSTEQQGSNVYWQRI